MAQCKSPLLAQVLVLLQISLLHPMALPNQSMEVVHATHSLTAA